MTKTASLDAQPKVGLAFDAQIIALQPEGIEPRKLLGTVAAFCGGTLRVTRL
ncbi:hypothetical protein [Rhizobium aouanii]|uniref:Uncharacterized protein n=1 Tax=Rhizobium aouanii TaxID=3118145 RepID=A0ABU8CV56_9HYPH